MTKGLQPFPPFRDHIPLYVNIQVIIDQRYSREPRYQECSLKTTSPFKTATGKLDQFAAPNTQPNPAVFTEKRGLGK